MLQHKYEMNRVCALSPKLTPLVTLVGSWIVEKIVAQALAPFLPAHAAKAFVVQEA
jgi:hypothetical protein